MKHILEHEFGLLRRRLLQIDPKKQVRVRQQCRHQKHFDVLAVQTSLRCKYERPNHLSHLSHSLRRVKLARMVSRMGPLASVIALHRCYRALMYISYQIPIPIGAPSSEFTGWLRRYSWSSRMSRTWHRPSQFTMGARQPSFVSRK